MDFHLYIYIVTLVSTNLYNQFLIHLFLLQFRLYIMGVTSISQEFLCPISPSRMFKALIIDSKNLIPKLLPQFIASVEVTQGDGGAGSIEQVNFTEG